MYWKHFYDIPTGSPAAIVRYSQDLSAVKKATEAQSLESALNDFYSKKIQPKLARLGPQAMAEVLLDDPVLSAKLLEGELELPKEKLKQVLKILKKLKPNHASWKVLDYGETPRITPRRLKEVRQQVRRGIREDILPPMTLSM